MRHVLVSSEREGLVEQLRAAADASTVFLPVRGLEETLELLGRSARVDAVVTDDPAVARAIREEIPGALPVHLAREEDGAGAILAVLGGLSGAS